MKILLVDDHAVVRQGFSAFLEKLTKSCQIDESSGNKNNILQLYRQHKHDIIITDFRLASISGLEIAHHLLEYDHNAKILFFSMYSELFLVQQAMQIGALGYLTKSCDMEEVLLAINNVVEGKNYIEKSLRNRMNTNNNAINQELNKLTRREFEIFNMLTHNQSLDEIAQKLALSKRTIANYQTSLKQKMNAKSIQELIHIGINMGLLN